MYRNNLNEIESQKNLNSKIKRYDIINYLIEKNKFINYLEIGVFHGENIRLIKASHKDGVDPGHEGVVAPEVNYPMVSDEFFSLIKGHDIKYDLIFIDGLHHADQVDKDIENSLNHIVEGGYIILHDCNPVSYDAQLIPRQTIVWNGDVWKSFVKFKKQYPNMECCVVDTDFGIGVIKKGDITSNPNVSETTWDEFDANRKQLLNLITVDEFKANY